MRYPVRAVRIGLLALLAAALLTLILAGLPRPNAVRAQGGDTPLPAFVPSRTPTPILEFSPTPSRTPTVNIGTIRVEARIEANIRSAPNLEAQVLAKVKPGRTYPVRGRYEKWLQIEFNGSPTGLAWVFEEVVKVTGGDRAAIPTIDLNAVPTANLETAAAQQTAEYLTQTPGAPETATALRASATGVFTRVAEQPQDVAPGAPLPTFTYPPPVVEATLPARVAQVSGGGLPPIVPIAGLGALGLAGLFVGALRRGR